MVINVSPLLWKEALNGNRNICIILKYILTTVEMNMHNMIFEDSVEVDRLIKDQSFSSFAETIKAISKYSFYSNKNRRTIRVTNINKMNLTENECISYYGGNLAIIKDEHSQQEFIDIGAVKSYLGNPLYIVVEDVNSDNKFLENIYKFMNNGKIYPGEKVKFIHGGGNQMPVVMQSFTEPVRLICMTDSDKKYPEHNIEIEEKILKIKEICSTNNFKLFILNKREIENYIPDNVLSIWLDKENRAKEKKNKYFKMNADQKTYFDMKKGLKIQDFNDRYIKELYKEVYDEISVTKLSDEKYKNEKIIDGFGKNVYQAFDELCICKKNDFDDCYDELSELVTLIDLNI
jgi:hypothetical protein